LLARAAFAARGRNDPRARNDHRYLSAGKIGGQCWQPAALTLGPAKLDRAVAAILEAGFGQALSERGHERRPPESSTACGFAKWPISIIAALRSRLGVAKR
jgi:hypothetical protein